MDSADLLRLVVLFVEVSVLGWCVDTALRSIRRRRFAPIRRVPFSPLYGLACLCIWAAPPPIGTSSWLVQFVILAVFICALEYAAGAVILRIRGARMWDYTQRHLHLHGHTDLFHFFLWGALGLVAFRWALPALAAPLGLPERLF